MKTFVGIDVSKRSLDVYDIKSEQNCQFENTKQGIQQCAKWIRSLKPVLVVMEATGGYEHELASALLSAKLPAAVVNAKRIRDFARAVGQLAKTDKIDARMIAQFAATLQPQPQKQMDQAAQKLKALVSRRTQLVDMRTAEKNRIEHARDAAIKKSIAAMVKTLDREIGKVDKQLSNHIDQDPRLRHKAKVMESMKGIGKGSATSLVAKLPELGQFNRRRISSLVGVCPINRDSGLFRGKRMIGGGRSDVRKLLYMPTLAAIRHNPTIRAFYQRLLKAGKAKMVAVVACMRKVLITLNAMIANDQMWVCKNP
jgi:transposase